MENKVIIGRQQQIHELREALNSSKPEMVASVGRRRVGKTFFATVITANKVVENSNRINHIDQVVTGDDLFVAF